MNEAASLKSRTLQQISGQICRTALAAAAFFYLLDAILPAGLSLITGWTGIIIIITGIPLTKKSYLKPAAVFISLSVFLIFYEGISFSAVIDGVNSMLAIAAIMTALQLFLIPIRAGRYDETLERYLKGRFASESSLFSFVSFISHIVGSFMLFGTVPMIYTFFGKPIKDLVKDPARFAVTAIGRSFTLVTLWAPGAVSVVLVLESTGAEWMKVIPVTLLLTIAGFASSILLEGSTVLKGNKIELSRAPEPAVKKADTKKIYILVIISLILLAGVMLLDLANLLTGSSRVILVGIVTAAAWTACHRRPKIIRAAFSEYWNSSLRVVPDLSVLFLSMGIFTKVIQASSFIDIFSGWVINTAGALGQFNFLIVTPFIIILSLTGIHPLMGVGLLGTLLSSALPGYSTMIALGLLLGSAISYSVSPFAGTIITLSRFAGCSSVKAAFNWNGLFSLIFFIEGLIILSAAALIL